MSIKDALIVAGEMLVIFGILTTTFLILAGIGADDVLKMAIGLSAALLTISAAMLILAIIPVPAALTAVAGLAIFAAGLAAILVALGGLAQIPGFEWIIGKGAKVLDQLGNAIGSFVANIIGGFLTGVSGSFEQIGNDLSAFMIAVTPFIEGTKNIDAASMNGVKALAETVLILTAASILDGLTNWLTGGSSMVKFGQQIAEFAPYFVDYYNQIKGVDGAVVEASANAAKSLAAFARNIPNSGGLLAKVTGENSITSFAEELKEFGPALMAYSRSVTGLNAEVVVNSSNAALALAEMANKLPKQGGVVGWFTGENTLSVFGEELAKFGPYLSSYARAITGLDGAVVVNSANVAKALAELANNLPNSGGLASLFSGDNNIADFGADVAEFGKKFAEYYEYVRGINMSQMQGVISSVNALVEMAMNVSSANIGGLKTFAQDLTKQGDLGIEGFLKSFTSANTKATTSVNTMITYVVTAISNGQPKVVTQFTTMVTAMIAVLNIRSNEFTTAIYTMMTLMGIAISSRQGNLVVTITTVIVAMINAVNEQRSEWENLGGYMVDGFIVGIEREMPRAIQAAVDMAIAALRAARAAIGANSPAKKVIPVGEYFDWGFAVGLDKYSYLAEESASGVGNTAVDSLSNAIAGISDIMGDDLDMTPTIRPVVDLTNVTNGAKTINSMLDKTNTINFDGTRVKAYSAIKDTQNENAGSTNEMGVKETSFSFTQNNYSPKPLSRIEIYRQTKNQFSAMKGLVNS
jgi:hypothetical protein